MSLPVSPQAGRPFRRRSRRNERGTLPLRGLFTALGFLTILPAKATSTGGMAEARAYFPVVGLLLGAGLAGLDFVLRRVFPVGLTNALLLASIIAATRGLHVEGFLDCCDALFGGFTRERRLEILKDHHVGAFAVIGGVLLLLLEWTALSALVAPARMLVLILFPCLSRCAMLLSMAAFPYARKQGLGTAFTQGANRWQVVAGFATAALASVILAGWVGLVLLAIASAIAWTLGAWITKLLGGLTGDGYGAINEVSSVGVLLAAVAMGDVLAPLWISLARA